MAEDTASRITRRALLGGAAAFAGYKGLEAMGVFNPKSEIEEVASEVVITTSEELRTSPTVPDRSEMPNTVQWSDLAEVGGEKYKDQRSIPLRLVPLVYGQNPNGPGRGKWAELDVKTKNGDQKRVFVAVDDILSRTAPSISKVQRIENGVIYTDAGQKIPQYDLGKVDMTRASTK